MKKNLISLILVFVILLPNHPFAFAGVNNSAAHITSQEKFKKELNNYYDTYFSAKPILESVLTTNKVIKVGKKQNWQGDSSLLDLDPFFMRSQKWTVKTTEFSKLESSQFKYQRSEDSLRLAHNDFKYDLEINLPLIPILDTREYLIFTLAQHSSLFDDMSNVNSNNQGLFYVSKLELFQAASNADSTNMSANSAVALHYFALPAQGWMGEIHAFEWTDTDEIVVYNNTEHIPLRISLEDIREHHKHTNLNLAFAKALTTLDYKNLNPSSIYPARGATAAFGSFLTGVNLDSPEHGIIYANNNLNRFKRSVKEFFNYLSPTAYAFDTSIITGELAERLLTFGKIISGVFVASVALKYTYYYHKTKDKYALLEKYRRMSTDEFNNYVAQKRTEIEIDSKTKLEGLTQSIEALKAEISTQELDKKIVEAKQIVQKMRDQELALHEKRHKLIVEFRQLPKTYFSIIKLAKNSKKLAIAITSLKKDKQSTSDFKKSIASKTTLVLNNIKSLNSKSLLNIAAKIKSEIYAQYKNGIFYTKSEIKEIFDVYAHGLTFFAKMSEVTIINSLEYLIDRFGSNRLTNKALVANNSLFRRAFTSTFGFELQNSVSLAVNAKTWFLGSIVMGTVDTLLVAVQLLVITPMIFEYMQWNSNLLGPATLAYVTAELVRNITGYFAKGAYGYSAEQKVIVSDYVTSVVDKKLRSMGKDPYKKEVRFERDEMIAIEFDKAMQLRGLPTRKDFMFDSNSVLKQAVEYIGYNIKTFDHSKINQNNYILSAGRWGLTYPALKRALKYAKIHQNAHNNKTAQQTIELLEMLKSRWSYISGIAKLPLSIITKRDVFQEAKEVRQLLTLFSFGGDLALIKKYYPDWLSDLDYSDNVIDSVALLYNDSLSSLIEGNETSLNINSQKGTRANEIRDFMGEYSPSKATQVIASLGIDDKDKNHLIESISKLYNNAKDDPFLLSIAEQKAMHIVNLALLQQNKLQKFKPKQDSFYTKLQKLRAHKLAQEEFGSLPQQSQNSTTYKEIYTTKLANAVHLFPKKDSELIEIVKTEAQELTEIQLSTSAESNYIAKVLSQEEAQRYIADVYAEHFLDAYRKHTVDAMDIVEASSEENPGTLQRFRILLKPYLDTYNNKKTSSNKWQLANIRTISSKFILNKTMSTIRIYEAFKSTGAHKAGFMPMLDRRVPFFHDMRQNFYRNAKRLPWTLTFGYLVMVNIWQVHMHYAVWGVFMFTNFTHGMMMEFNNRAQQNLGIKPMEDVRSKVSYSFWHSWLTYPTVFPIVFVTSSTIPLWWDKNITERIASTFQSAVNLAEKTLTKSSQYMDGVASTCSDLLTRVF